MCDICGKIDFPSTKSSIFRKKVTGPLVNTEPYTEEKTSVPLSADQAKNYVEIKIFDVKEKEDTHIEYFYSRVERIDTLKNRLKRRKRSVSTPPDLGAE